MVLGKGGGEGWGGVCGSNSDSVYSPTYVCSLSSVFHLFDWEAKLIFLIEIYNYSDMHAAKYGISNATEVS